MKGLDKLTNQNLSVWVQEARTQAEKGKVVERIPLLATVKPDLLGVHICCESGNNYSAGDIVNVFPLMSVIKPFSLLYLLEVLGAERVFQWVGVKPSNKPFNSLEQLVADDGYPRNPMINSGAITLAKKLPGENAVNSSLLFCQWLNNLAGSHLYIDEKMLACVRDSRSSANVAIAHYLTQSQHLNNPDLALDIYEQICCISGQVEDLAKLGKVLACKSGLVSCENRRLVNALMLTCGLYEESSEMAVKIGLPMKSGIGGGLLAIVPHQGAIACYSPALDIVGNPVAGLALTETLAQQLQLSIFG
ncbi:MAG TPA: glutaminase [Nostocaceae cyanobacterium]|nr:glutaminase [Nostocaceae cyanobacterium]